MITAAGLFLFLGALAIPLSAADGHKHDGHDHGHGVSEKKISAALNKLSPKDRELARAQRFCPMMPRTRLGSDGTPQKVLIDGKPVFVCCEDCVPEAKEDGRRTLSAVRKLTRAAATLAKLPPDQRADAETQKFCAVNTNSLLGSMGTPVRMTLKGQTVLLCCRGCVKKAQSRPDATLARVARLRKEAEHGDHHHGDHDHD